MSPIRVAKFEEAVRVVLAFTDAFNRKDINAMRQQVSENFHFESSFPAPYGAKYEGKAEATRFWEDILNRWPGIRKEIEDIFGFGSRCIMQYRYQWTNATGEGGHIRGVDIYRVKDELITEQLSYVKGER